MKWTGGCLCGAIRYRTTAAPTWAAHCHCTMCRKVSGAAFMTFVEFPPGSFHWTQGEPTDYVSSPGVKRKFCAQCGSSLTFEPGDMFFVSAGSLDQAQMLEVESHCYTRTRLPWIALADHLPQHLGPRGDKGGRPD